MKQLIDQIIGGKIGASVFSDYLSIGFRGSKIGFVEAELVFNSGPPLKIEVVSDEEYERLKKIKAFQ